MTSRAVTAAIVLLLLVHVGAAMSLTGLHDSDRDSWRFGFFSDVDRQREIQESDGRPYRDFEVEYPPLTLLEIHVLTTDDAPGTVARFAWAQLAMEMGMIVALGWAWGRRVVLAYLVISLPLMAYPFVLTRTDLLACAFAVGSMALLAKRAPVAGAAVLGASVFVKLWPFVLAPALLVRRAHRGFVTFTTVCVVGGLLWIGWGGVRGPWQVLSFRHARGWQIESVIGELWHVATGGTPYEDQGSMRIGTMPAGAPVVLGLVALALVAVIWGLARRAADDDRVVFGVASLGAVAALLSTAAILSPQYMIWLVPWAAITAAQGEGRSRLDLAAGVMIFLANGATALSFRSYGQLERGTLFGHSLMLARNGLVVGVLVVVIARLSATRPTALDPTDTPQRRQRLIPS